MAPSVTFSAAPSGGTTATGTALLGVTGVTVTSAGSGYTSAPTVAISGGGGAGATGIAVISGGVVTGVTIVTGGSGYTSAPTITFSGGGGSGAAGTVTRGVTGVTISNGGAGYATVPTVTFSGGTGSGASGTAMLTNNFNTVSFWMNWNGSVAGAPMPIGFSSYAVLFNSSGGNNSFGFNTANSDTYGVITSGGITGATNAGPIVITTSTTHGLATGAKVQISGVAGNTAANGTFTITVVDTTHFSLNGSTGNAAYTGGGTWTPLFGTSATPLANNWHFVTAVFNNGNVALNQLWIDGVQQTIAQRVGTSAIRNISTAARLGGWPNDGNNRYTGALDEVAYFNRALAPAEIAAQYSAGTTIGGNYSSTVLGQNPIGYYRLGESSGSVAVDSSPYGYNGDYDATPTWVASTAPIYGSLPANSGSSVKGVIITSGGSYASVPTVGFTGGSGTGAAATASVSTGGVTINSGGSGYTGIPSITFSGGGATTQAGGVVAVSATGVILTNGGSGYSTAPTVTFSAPGFGTTATGTAIINGSGVVTGVTITNPGSGYTSFPTIALSAPTSGTTATGTVTASVNAVYLTSGGFGYFQAPVVVFSAPPAGERHGQRRRLPDCHRCHRHQRRHRLRFGTGRQLLRGRGLRSRRHGHFQRSDAHRHQHRRCGPRLAPPGDSGRE